MMLALEDGVRGTNEERQELSKDLLTIVIPRLLRPLETEVRSIKPSLLHENLWIGNIASEKATKKPFMFDSSAYYGHHECGFKIFKAIVYY